MVYGSETRLLLAYVILKFGRAEVQMIGWVVFPRKTEGLVKNGSNDTCCWR